MYTEVLIRDLSWSKIVYIHVNVSDDSSPDYAYEATSDFSTSQCKIS